MSDTQTRFQCRHIFTDGHRCASPSLRHEHFCYYHHTTRRPVKNLAERRAKQAAFTLPTLEDRSAIQLAINEVLQRIAANEIDSRRAGLLLYGLQIASLNLPKPTPPDPQAIPPTTIEEITQDPDLGPIAPPAEFKGREPEKDFMTLLNERWDRDRQRSREEDEAARLKLEKEREETNQLLIAEGHPPIDYKAIDQRNRIYDPLAANYCTSEPWNCNEAASVDWPPRCMESNGVTRG